MTWDALLLTCAVAHADCALVAVVRDHRTRPASRRRWTLALGAAAVAILLVGAAALAAGATRS